MPEGVLVASGIRKRYGGLVVLDDVSLALRAGARLGVIGPNGSGKTTLLGVLSGFVRAGGQVRLAGRDVSRHSATSRARAGMARTFQIAAVMTEWTVFENVAFAAAMRRGLTHQPPWPLRRNAAIRACVEHAAARWALEECLHMPVATLSYGMVRRTELAMATLGEPHVLLLDEPAAGLSTEDGREVAAIVDQAFPQAGIVLVDHDMDVMFGFCDELLVLDHGRVVAAGDPATVRADPAVKAAYLGSSV